MADIFLSYASEDGERVKPLVDYLQSLGWTVWWDRELVAGSSFDAKIEEALDAARCVIVAWTRHSIESRWCRAEALDGLERQILVPLRLDDVRPPLVFRSSQTASLIGWPTQRGEIDVLLSGIRECLGARAEATDKAISPNFDRSVSITAFTGSGGREGSSYASTLQDEVLGHLTQYQELRTIDVTGPTASGASYRVVATVRHDADHLRVRMGLLRNSDSQSVWSQTFDLDRRDVHSDPYGLASTIARQLRLQVLLDHDCEVVRRKSSSAEAARLFRIARTESHRISQGGDFDCRLLLANIERAAELEPKSAEIQSLLSGAHVWSVYYLGVAWRTASQAAHAALTEALSIDPSSPEAWTSLGSVQCIFDLDYASSDDSYGRAIVLNPSVLYAHNGLGSNALRRGSIAEAVDHYRRAIRIFDGDARICFEYARALNCAGDYREAVVAAEKGLELIEGGVYVVLLTAEQVFAHLALRDTENAEMAIERAQKSAGPSLAPLFAGAMLDVGRTEDARRMLGVLQQRRSVPPSVMVRSYSSIGDLGRAVEWVNKGIDGRDALVLEEIRVHPRFAALRQDAVWTEISERLQREEAEGCRTNAVAEHRSPDVER